MDHRMLNGNILASGIDMLAVGKDDLSTAMACTNHVHHQQATLADVQYLPLSSNEAAYQHLTVITLFPPPDLRWLDASRSQSGETLVSLD